MRVLVAWPPHVPSYFNAGHHLAVYTTAAHLRTLAAAPDVQTNEYGLLNVSWKEIGEDLYQFSPDVLIIVNDFDTVDNLDRFIEYSRTLCPNVRIITAGRLSTEAPAPFRQYDLDAIVESGDIELGIAAYVDAVRQGADGDIPGVATRRDGSWHTPSAPGARFAAGEWPLPDVREIPYEHYDRLYARDQSKFCGIPQRRELVVPVGRGCPINCSFCDVPTVQGLRDRRLSPDDIVAYIEEAQAVRPFDYVSFYAPTFTFNRRWMIEFCDKMGASAHRLPWKCATAIPHLDEDLMRRMADAGCIRISVGLETLEPTGLATLPRKKQTDVLRFDELNQVAQETGIELNFFVMVGLPGTTLAGTRATIDAARSVGARVRPTVYSDLSALRSTTSKDDLWRFNRQLLFDGRGEDSYPWYEFFFGRDEHVTSVMARIPKVHGEGGTENLGVA